MLRFVDHQLAKVVDSVNPMNVHTFIPGTAGQAYRSRANVYKPRNKSTAIVLAATPYKSRGRFGTRALGSNKEKKFHDVEDQANSTTTAGTISEDLLVIEQGVAENQRVGRKIWIRQINMRIVLGLGVQATAVGGGSIQTRLMLIHDKQCNGALPTVLDVLETADQLSYRNLANAARFTVLKDKLVTLQPPSGAGDGAANDFSQALRIYKYSKKCNIPISFSGTTGAIAQKTTGNVFVLAIASNTLGTWTSALRFRFTD